MLLAVRAVSGVRGAAGPDPRGRGLPVAAHHADGELEDEVPGRVPLSWGFSSPICSDVQLSYQNSNCCNNPSATASCFVQATELESTVQYMDAKLKAMEVPSKIYKMIDLSMTYLANKNDRSHPDSVYYTIDIKDETAYLAEAYKLVRDLSAPDIEYHLYMNGQAGKELSGISYDFRTLLSSSFTGTEISLLTTMAFSSSGVQATWPALVRVYYWYAWFWVVANGRVDGFASHAFRDGSVWFSNRRFCLHHRC